MAASQICVLSTVSPRYLLLYRLVYVLLSHYLRPPHSAVMYCALPVYSPLGRRGLLGPKGSIGFQRVEGSPPLTLFVDDSTLCRTICHTSYQQAAASSLSADLDIITNWSIKQAFEKSLTRGGFEFLVTVWNVSMMCNLNLGFQCNLQLLMTE